MRAGMTPALEQRTRRVDRTARPMIEAAVVTQADVRQRKDQWQAADSNAGLSLLDDGGVRLADTIATVIQSVTQTAYLTDLNRAFPLFGAMIEWAGADSTDLELRRLQIWLNPKVNGAANKEVVNWKVELLALDTAAGLSPTLGERQLVLRPICDPVTIAALGDGEGYVLFDFGAAGLVKRPRPKRFLPDIPVPLVGNLFNTGPVPTTFILVYALKADGTAAGNVGWAYDAGVASVTSAGNILSGRRLNAPYVPVANLGGLFQQGTHADGGSAGGAPRIIVETGTYVAAGLRFSGGGNQLTLPVVPTADVEFGGAADIPFGASCTFQVLKDGGNPAVPGDWVTYLPGQKSTDLVGVSKRATYQLQALLAPNGAGNLTPILRGLSVKEVTTVDLSLVAEVVDVQWAVDPLTLVSEIAQCRLRAIRDGQRDYQDAITALLATTDIGNITVRLWWGDASLPRTAWMPIDDFLIDGTQPLGAECQLVLVSPLQLLLDFIPKYQAGSNAAPIADTAVGAWTTDAGGGANLFQRIDEAAADDTDFVQSELDPANSAYEAKVAVLGDPVGRAHYVDYRYRKSVAGGKRIDLTVELRQAAVVLASVVLNDIGPDWTTGSLQLTDAQVATITDYTDLRIHVKANESGAGAAERGQVSWARLRTGAKRVAPLYTNQPLNAVYDDLVNNQIGLDARFRGPGIQNATDLVTRNFGDVSPSEADAPLGKAQVDALAAIAGGAVISSQGRIKFVDFFGAQPVAAVFPSEEIRVISVSPGYEQRVPEFFVSVRWNPGKQDFDDEVRIFHGPALLALGKARIDPPRSLDPEISKWIPDDVLGGKVGDRFVRAIGPGLLLWHYVSSYAYPELEPGDVVAIETEQFVAKDPNAARALSGRQWAIAIIQRQHDVEGREFTAWVRSYADIGTTQELASRLGFQFGNPQVTSIALSVADTGVVSAVLHTMGAQSVKVASSTAGFPTAATVRAAGAQAVDGSGNLVLAALATLTDGQTLYVSVLAYENAAAAGAESALATAQLAFRYQPAVSILNAHAVWRGPRLLVSVAGNTGVASFKVATSTAAFPAVGTGTLTVGQDGAFDAGVFLYGDTVFVTVTPYPDAAGAGVPGPAMRFRARLAFHDTLINDGDGKIYVSTALNPQASAIPIPGGGGTSMFSWKGGGLGTGQMWLSFGWSAQTAYRPDGTTVSIPAPPAAPGAPVLSQVAGGALGARTRWARIAYVRVLGGQVLLYPVSAEASLAINANNLLKITSPASVAGYDGWVALVGSAANAEFVQGTAHALLAFGTDYTEPSTGFNNARSQYDNANWKSVTIIDLATSTTFSVYPYYDLVSGKVELGPFQGAGGDAATAAMQRADQHIPLSTLVSGTYSGQPQTPAAAGSTSGSFGGGALG